MTGGPAFSKNIDARAEKVIFDQINVIADNKNVVKAIINGTFTENCTIDTGTHLSFLDKAFVELHCLQLTPIKPEAKSVYLTAGKTKIRAIGNTSITLSFAKEDFVFEFQVVDNLSVIILFRMDFILSNHCVPFANKNLFSLRNGRVCVPMQVGVGSLAVKNLGKSVILRKSVARREQESATIRGRGRLKSYEPSPKRSKGASSQHDGVHQSVW